LARGKIKNAVKTIKAGRPNISKYGVSRCAMFVSLFRCD
jgi:hypothetical protein